MIAAEGEGSPAESGPGAPGLGHRSDSHLSSPAHRWWRQSEIANCSRSRSRSPERDGRGGCLSGKEGRREGKGDGGVSHGRAPSCARLESPVAAAWDTRPERAPPARSLAKRVKEGSHSSNFPRRWLRRHQEPKCPRAGER